MPPRVVATNRLCTPKLLRLLRSTQVFCWKEKQRDPTTKVQMVGKLALRLYCRTGYLPPQCPRGGQCRTWWRWSLCDIHRQQALERRLPSRANPWSLDRLFFTEAWPAQPEPVRETRPPALSASGFSWVARLGEFLRTHVPGGVETRTTLTRQVLGQGTEGGGVMVRQEHVQHTMSQPTSPTSRQLPTFVPEAGMQPQTAEQPPGRDGDLPLFGPNARRVMESWMQRAPLLYPQGQTGGPGTDPGSSASIPRELVQEEVRRQVREALEGQRRSLEDLREENRLLRNEMGLRSVRAASLQQDGSTAPSRREYFDYRPRII